MKENHAIYIVGSGLSAVAAAAALVRRGFRPTILDAGLSPEPNALTLKARLAASGPDEWRSEDLNSARRIGPIAANGIPRKLYFGSDFTFREIDLAPALEVSEASIHRSFAAGGFSNVWGAVIEPLPPREMRDWPVTFEELAPHYGAVRRMLCDTPDISKIESDAAVNRFVEALRPSSQARALYADLWTNRRDLERAGIRFEYAQLAVRAADHSGDKGCCYCGLCLHGCPYDCKYTAAAALRQLIREDHVAYIPGVVVDKVTPGSGHVLIAARSLADGAFQSFRGQRVLMAAGLLETSKTILTSLGLYGMPFQVKHSDIFTLPVVRFSSAPRVVHERLHTLCQLVMQIEEEAICPHPVHLQVYGYNKLYAELMARKMGFWAHPFSPTLRALTTRLFIIFGYLHSSVSSTVTLTLTGDRNPRLRLEGQPNAQALSISRAVSRKLFRNRKFFRAIPIGFRLRLDLPGGGYHSGGVFPMRDKPEAFETDRLGSLASLPGVHIVDTAVLPEIPPFPTAFTAMANAHRIASELDISYGE
jgi:choline dehydrogenase-like flavoprotein